MRHKRAHQQLACLAPARLRQHRQTQMRRKKSRKLPIYHDIRTRNTRVELAVFLQFRNILIQIALGVRLTVRRAQHIADHLLRAVLRRPHSYKTVLRLALEIVVARRFQHKQPPRLRPHTVLRRRHADQPHRIPIRFGIGSDCDRHSIHAFWKYSVKADPLQRVQNVMKSSFTGLKGFFFIYQYI